jgi:serine/threonine-protein kinase
MDRPAPNPDSDHPASCQPPSAPPNADGSSVPTGPYGGVEPDTPFSQQQTTPDGTTLSFRPASGTVGNYELLAEVARGGMGIVYQARHATRGQVVALKMMQGSAADPQHAGRFDREVRVATWLKHPNIVPVYDVSRHQGEPYYTMEFVPGGSLALQRERLLADPSAVLTLMAKVAEAIQHAHGQGVVHRDLKLSNVLLAADGTPKVTDFGLAKLSAGDLNLTQTGAAVGTVPYMAPEQAAGRTKQIGPATDIWALGVMLYELLTGRRPFGGEDSDAVKRQIRKSDPPRPRTLRPELSEAVEQVVLRCLEKEPRRRYQTAGELADHLRRCARSEPIPPQPECGFRRLGNAMGRHPLKSAVLMVCVIAVAAAAAALLERGPGHPQTPARPEEQPQPGMTLLDESGPRGPFRWVWGEKYATLGGGKAGEPFWCRSSQTSLLELQGTLSRESFRVEAAVRQDANVQGLAGIYFAHQRYRTAQNVYHCCGLLVVTQAGENSPGVVRLAFSCIPESEARSAGRTITSTEFDVPAPPPGKQPDRWHSLAVEVDPQEIRVYWNSTRIGFEPRALLQERISGQFREFLDWEFTPRGGVGLYLYKTAASFHQVVVKSFP